MAKPTIVRNTYEITVCCIELGGLIYRNRAEPVETWFENVDGWVHNFALDMVDANSVCIITMYYCPSCGTKIQMRKVNNGQATG